MMVKEIVVTARLTTCELECVPLFLLSKRAPVLQNNGSHDKLKIHMSSNVLQVNISEKEDLQRNLSYGSLKTLMLSDS